MLKTHFTLPIGDVAAFMVRFAFLQAPLIEIFVLDQGMSGMRGGGDPQEKLEFRLQ
ncbi:MAG: hypothetical protein KJ947_19310 [Alphaproteobacteria bacterium]|jgi:hypothetical protein|uniref:hypothetical protein n=1 Tax=Pseudorhizobium pelagicum TaxID=1509405 RepID=UPI001D229114|nr:hypothetical protein [Alphaproteobacteria bacterium]MBU1551699.1 hypothetical protein [Alphaproteobacteria bacterium]MBU2335127.1 hypothetical protein [Alphaproteobacteria bacterium]MBU2391157.1 hypothetical protein [Alphaproteobacteria bacterium]|tara:strand:+ start:646 stop:813 length:168 start_codon:yes stop_codon:yes gene_type:complete